MVTGYNLIIHTGLTIIITRKVDLADTSIGVFYFQNLKMMFFDQVDNRTDDLRFHHLEDYCLRRKFRTIIISAFYRFILMDALAALGSVIMVIVDQAQTIFQLKYAICHLGMLTTYLIFT